MYLFNNGVNRSRMNEAVEKGTTKLKRPCKVDKTAITRNLMANFPKMKLQKV